MAGYNYITETGIIIPDTSENLTSVQQEFKETFGEDLVLNPETPQGVIINQLTLGRNAVAENNAQLANQINPNYAGGVFLDAIMSLTGMQRRPAQFSSVLANVSGVPGVIIPTTSIAALTTGEQFSPVEQIIIDSLGTGSGIFKALTAGAISVTPNSLTIIVSGPIGWETVNNPSQGTLGSVTQSDQEARFTRNVTLARQGHSTAEAIVSGLYADSNLNVYSVSFRENVDGVTQVIDGVTMLPHSIYVNVTNNAPLTRTQVLSQLVGDPGTVIPVGSQASDGSNVYSLIGDVLIDTQGVGIGVFQSVALGSFNVPIGQLNIIVTPVLGWASVSNENPSSVFSQDFLNGVAKVLSDKKSSGSNYNIGNGDPPYGGYTVKYSEPTSGQIMDVTFGTPTPVPILIRCTVTTTPQFVGDPSILVQDAIINYSKSIDGFLIGKNVSAFDLSNVVNEGVVGLSVSNMLITKSSPYSTNEIPIEIWEQAITFRSAITVLVTNSNALLVKR